MTQAEREELRAVGERLIAMAGSRQGTRAPVSDHVSFAREEVRRRRARELIFPSGFFGEPAWNILLDLFIAMHERRRLSVTDIFVFAGSSETSTLRYLKVLESSGYISRTPDRKDNRRTFIELTNLADCALRKVFDEMAPLSSDPPIARAEK